MCASVVLYSSGQFPRARVQRLFSELAALLVLVGLAGAALGCLARDPHVDPVADAAAVAAAEEEAEARAPPPGVVVRFR